MTRNGTVVGRRLYNCVLCSKGFIPWPVYPIPPISTDLLVTCLCGTTRVYVSRQPAIPHADTHVRNLRIHECTLALVWAAGRVGSRRPGCVTQLLWRPLQRSHGGEAAMRSRPHQNVGHGAHMQTDCIFISEGQTDFLSLVENDNSTPTRLVSLCITHEECDAPDVEPRTPHTPSPRKEGCRGRCRVHTHVRKHNEKCITEAVVCVTFNIQL